MPERLTFHWRFFLKWIGANFLAIVFLGLLGPLTLQLFPASTSNPQAVNMFLPFILMAGVVVGGLQGAVLSDHFRDRRLTMVWLLAYTLGAVINLTWVSSALQIGAGILSAIVAGLINGSLTWIILRKYVHKAQWWIAANMIASVLAFINSTLSILAIIVTGFTLAWLVCDPIQQQKPAAAE